MIWIIADLFLTAVMVRKANQRAGVAASYAATPQRIINVGSDMKEEAYKGWPREEEKQQRAEEARGTQEVEARAEAKMLPPMPKRLASVSGVVDLLPDEALDETQEFLTRQGYEIVRRTDRSITGQRAGQQFFLPDSTSTFTSTREVLVHPQPGGAVRIETMIPDLDPVPEQQQAEWKEWAESLPRRMGEQNVSDVVVWGHEAKEESSNAEVDATASRGDVDTKGERDVSELLERFEPAEDRWGVRLEGLFAKMDQANRHVHLNGELHPREGHELSRDLEVVATVHDSSGKVVHKQTTSFYSESFFGFEAFSMSMEAGGDLPSKIRVCPKTL